MKVIVGTVDSFNLWGKMKAVADSAVVLWGSLTGTITANTQVTDESTAAIKAAVTPYQNQIDLLKQQLQVRKDSATAEKEAAAVIAETTKALDALGKVMQRYGEDELKMAHDTFANKLKEENVTIAAMQAGLTSYLVTLNEVYDARIAGEKAVAEVMAASGAKPAEILKEQEKF